MKLSPFIFSLTITSFILGNPRQSVAVALQKVLPNVHTIQEANIRTLKHNDNSTHNHQHAHTHIKKSENIPKEAVRYHGQELKRRMNRLNNENYFKALALMSNRKLFYFCYSHTASELKEALTRIDLFTEEPEEVLKAVFESTPEKFMTDILTLRKIKNPNNDQIKSLFLKHFKKQVIDFTALSYYLYLVKNYWAKSRVLDQKAAGASLNLFSETLYLFEKSSHAGNTRNWVNKKLKELKKNLTNYDVFLAQENLLQI